MSSAPQGGGRGGIDPSMMSNGPTFATPYIAPNPEYPSMTLNPTATFQRDGSYGGNHQAYRVEQHQMMPGRQPQQQFVPQQMYNPTSQYAQQPPYFYQQPPPNYNPEMAMGYQQPMYTGYNAVPPQHNAAQMAPAHPPAAPKKKNILCFTDPNTGTELNLVGSAPAAPKTEATEENKAPVPAKPANDVRPADPEREAKRKAFLKDFEKVVGIEGKEQTDGRSSESESTAKASAEPIKESADNAKPTAVPVVDVAVPEKETVKEKPASNTDQMVPHVVISQQKAAEPTAPTKEVPHQKPSVKESEAEAVSPAQPSESVETSEDREEDCGTTTADEREETEREETDPVSQDEEEIDEEKRREEEQERRRQRESELDALLEKLLADKAEVDQESHIFGRAFLYCVRDIEKEFKRTACPLSPEQLAGFGIDLSSMPKGHDGKRREVNFNPSWAKNSTGNRQNRPYSGRNSHHERGGGRGRGSQGGGGKFSRQSFERPPKMALPNKSENAWKPEKIKPEDLEKEEIRVKLLLKKVRSLMNKITPTTKDDLIREFLSYNVSSTPANLDSKDNEQLKSVIDVIFDKAVEEPRFCPLYSEVCKRQVESELKENPRESKFRNGLLNRAQSTFVNKTQEDERLVKVKAIEDEEDPKKKQILQGELEEADGKFRRRKFGNITFIGQLYRQSLLSTKIAQWCLYELIRHTHPVDGVPATPPFDEESLQCAVQMLQSLGQKLETAPDFNGKVYLDQTLDHLKGISSKCSNKIRFMILGVIELRANHWVERKVVEQGPKKITEIHNDIMREQLANQQQRDSYDRKAGLRTGGGSLRRNAPPSRNSLDNRYTGGNRQDRQAMAATKSKLAPSTAPPKNLSLSQVGDRDNLKKSAWRSGASGGGANDAPPQIASRHSMGGWGGRNGSRDGGASDAGKASLADRTSALAAASMIGGGNLDRRSQSQLSIASQEEESEEAREERENGEKKLVNSINSDLQEVLSNDLSMKEMVDDLLANVGKEKYGKPTLATIFKCFAQSAVEKVKQPHLQMLGHILCMALQDKEKRSESIKGFSKYCEMAVDTEAWVDAPNVWTKLAEVIISAVQCPPPETGDDQPAVETTTNPLTLNDFADVFVEAGKDSREDKPYQLLITALRIMAENNARQSSADDDHMMASSMEYEELNFISQLDKTRLEAGLKSCRPDVAGVDSLYALLQS